ncbi:transcription factor HES-5-like [Takifugu flavidus]|nr:transcription factor HES-5-like [Takifugu flavidus]
MQRSDTDSGDFCSTAMVSTSAAAMNKSQEQLTLTHKLRKPLVEKLRRERINSSIEQLKSLLGPEFLKQQPDSKMEKADVLEMTVCILRQMQQRNQARNSPAGEHGYSRCVKEVGQFLSRDQVQTQRRLMEHLTNLQCSTHATLTEMDFSPAHCTPQTSVTKDRNPVKSSHWRPW